MFLFVSAVNDRNCLLVHRIYLYKHRGIVHLLIYSHMYKHLCLDIHCMLEAGAISDRRPNQNLWCTLEAVLIIDRRPSHIPV